MSTTHSIETLPLISDSRDWSLDQTRTRVSVSHAPDEALVHQLSSAASNRLTKRLASEPAASETERRDIAEEVIQQVLLEQTETVAAAGQPTWTHAQSSAIADAIYNTLFAPERLDYALVRSLRSEAAERLSQKLEADPDLSEAGQRKLGKEVIQEVLLEHTERAMASGLPTWTPTQTTDIADAIYDALFGLGRLQKHVDNNSLDNIHVVGHDQVWLHHWDGRIERAAPIADSDQELIEQLDFLASRPGSNRSFSPANRALHLTLADGHRLAATAWNVPRPAVSIRRHRFISVSLDELVAPSDPSFLPMMSDHVATFLRAAVTAQLSMIVGGDMDTAKTTLVRALAAACGPDEDFATLETERELHLDRLPGRTGRVLPFESSPGAGGELTGSGARAGEHLLDDMLKDALRFSVNRLFVGEVRGSEIVQLLKVTQMGASSISSVHIRDGESAIDRLAFLAMEAGTHMTAELAMGLVGRGIDLVIYTSHRKRSDGRKHRYISEIIALGTDMENGRPSVTKVYSPGPDGMAEPVLLPDHLRERLERNGLPAGHFANRSVRL